MPTRILNVMFAKNGQGRTSTRITLPLPWLREMGVTEEDKQVSVSFDGEKIVIQKSDSAPQDT